MEYNQYQNLEDLVLKSDSLFAKLEYLELSSLMSSQINSYRFTFSDLDEIEREKLHKIFNLSSDENILGNSVVKVIYNEEYPEGILSEIRKIDIIKVLDVVHLIKTKQWTE